MTWSPSSFSSRCHQQQGPPLRAKKEYPRLETCGKCAEICFLEFVTECPHAWQGGRQNNQTRQISQDGRFSDLSRLFRILHKKELLRTLTSYSVAQVAQVARRRTRPPPSATPPQPAHEPTRLEGALLGRVHLQRGDFNRRPRRVVRWRRGRRLPGGARWWKR